MKGLNVSFHEEQKFNQWWLKAILGGTVIIMIYSIYATHQNSDLYQSSSSAIGFWLSMIAGIAATLWVWFWKLDTKITNYGIEMNCFPVKKKVNWEEIDHLEVVDYGFIGGWGIRIGTKYGTVYNTSGKIGLAIKLKSGKKFLIGTQKENQLIEIVEKWKSIS